MDPLPLFHMNQAERGRAGRAAGGINRGAGGRGLTFGRGRKGAADAAELRIEGAENPRGAARSDRRAA